MIRVMSEKGHLVSSYSSCHWSVFRKPSCSSEFCEIPEKWSTWSKIKFISIPMRKSSSSMSFLCSSSNNQCALYFWHKNFCSLDRCWFKSIKAGSPECSTTSCFSKSLTSWFYSTSSSYSESFSCLPPCETSSTWFSTFFCSTCRFSFSSTWSCAQT